LLVFNGYPVSGFLACRLALCLVATLVAGPTVRAADPFESLNEAFRLQHADARDREWSRRGPVILVEFDKLTLINGDDRKSAEVIPPRYNRLKTISHTPFAIYLCLSDVGIGPVDERQQTQLKDIAARVKAVQDALASADFSPEDLKRQREILERCSTFIADTLKTKLASPKDLEEFVAGLRPLVMKNVAEAAEAQIRGFDSQIAAWQQAFPGLAWENLKVVITGSALPRKQNLATQYFARLLGVSGECPRLVYAESLYDEAKALRLLNATAVDARAGTVFFDDPTFLHRDLMAGVTAAFLRDHGSELKARIVPGHR
jgi:hypothetical protein